MRLLSGNERQSFGGLTKDRRKIKRRSPRSQAWVRFEGSFAVRAYDVIDISNGGVRLVMNRPDSLSGEFTLMTSRTDSCRRRARILWRRGTQIGAEFL